MAGHPHLSRSRADVLVDGHLILLVVFGSLEVVAGSDNLRLALDQRVNERVFLRDCCVMLQRSDLRCFVCLNYVVVAWASRLLIDCYFLESVILAVGVLFPEDCWPAARLNHRVQLVISCLRSRHLLRGPLGMFNERVELFFFAATLVLGCLDLADILSVLVVTRSRNSLFLAIPLDLLRRSYLGALQEDTALGEGLFRPVVVRHLRTGLPGRKFHYLVQEVVPLLRLVLLLGKDNLSDLVVWLLLHVARHVVALETELRLVVVGLDLMICHVHIVEADGHFLGDH